jgi:CheY-like chemotaxis protein
MIDRARFEADVHEALAHLYDFPFLERSPVAERLELRAARGGGPALHRRLVETIERLKPPRDVAADAVAWKVYRLLLLRYVRSLSASAVAAELGLSTRQAQRVQSVAISSLATLLSDQASVAAPVAAFSPSGLSEFALATPERSPAEGTVTLLDDALAAVLAGEHSELEAFPGLLRGALETVAPVLAARGLRFEVSIDQALDQRIAPRDLLRPALLQLLLGAVDLVGAGDLFVRATLVDEQLHLIVEAATTPSRAAVTVDSPDLERRLRVARTLLARLDGEIFLDLTLPPRVVARARLATAPVVLVVEDNPDVAQLFRRYVAGSPFQIALASNGLQGFELAVALQPAAITLDLLMPQRDGWELLQALKVHPKTRDIPAIVCSVLRERELALALGAAEVLTKPVSQHTFLRALHQHVPPPAPPKRPAERVSLGPGDGRADVSC